MLIVDLKMKLSLCRFSDVGNRIEVQGVPKISLSRERWDLMYVLKCWELVGLVGMHRSLLPKGR